MTKIAVLVSGGGTNLQALIDAQARGELGNGKITLVIASKPGVYALERAKNANIEGKVLSRTDYNSIADYSKALADEMTSQGIDLVVLAGFLTIIDEQVYNAFPNRIINVHPALIPSFCGKGFYGLHVHEAALEKGVKVSGATVHIVTPECDAGPIILQKAVEVKQDDTPETLQKRIMEEAEWKILPEAVRLFCEGRIMVENGRVHIINKNLSVCGIDCNTCKFYLEKSCAGCRIVAPEGKTVWNGRCALYDCASEKKLEHCGKCVNFPCDTLKEWASSENPERIQNLIDIN